MAEDAENQLDREGDKCRGLVHAKETKSTLKMIWHKKKHRWIGHVLRHENFLHDIISIIHCPRLRT